VLLSVNVGKSDLRGVAEEKERKLGEAAVGGDGASFLGAIV
jgi:hypothetical protein